jgi:hypothetical protein
LEAVLSRFERKDMQPIEDTLKGLLMAANLLEPSMKFDHTVRGRHIYIFGHNKFQRKEFMAEIWARGKIKPIKGFSSPEQWLDLV